VAVTPASAPQAAFDDVLLGPWLRYTEQVLRTRSAVLWREAVDLTGEHGEVTSLLGAGGLMAAGLANPRYLFLPIAPEVPAAGEFSERLGGVHVPQLDLEAYGMNLQCHIVDLGPGGLLGTQRDWVYRETGVAPPSTFGERPDDVRVLLRALREPVRLAGGPAWLGDAPAERIARLRSLVEESLTTFGAGRDDALAAGIIRAAYLGEAASHETIARSLNLSRSAYFRRLHVATERLVPQLETLVGRMWD
jgi:hypothetical protein